MSEDSKGAWLTLLAIVIGIMGFYVVNFMINYKKPPVEQIRGEIRLVVQEIIDVGELEKEVPKEFWQTDKNIFSQVNTGLNYLGSQCMSPKLNKVIGKRINDYNFGEKVFHLQFAIKYAEDAWNFSKKENLVDADRYLKAAKDHLEIAKKTAKSQGPE